ncbi:uncharacterized protein N7515_008800 [Penicillium bovifimosum]|uniref:Uncharacterized protein n=1 Tax=Penicillium bovifimosum TaxID=126998 RepID=A0A9W9KXQ6_9EURO|nr:uncharacterized protein N7515_008800 [Penicillium bovifimosum]KAJ5124975.1 hypothetical protein N7515_008800 [Penicillium bovifimosum]
MGDLHGSYLNGIEMTPKWPKAIGRAHRAADGLSEDEAWGLVAAAIVRKDPREGWIVRRGLQKVRDLLPSRHGG